ncbi:MAG: hypothetical protein ACOWWM_11230 [Desulfobacterales bacterium]
MKKAMRKRTKRGRLATILVLLALVFVLAACEQEGPAERAGEKIDEAAETTAEKMEDAGEAVEEKAEEVKEEAKKAAD